jgi:hypothetical protein
VLASELEQGRQQGEEAATASELLGEPSSSDLSLISLSGSGLGFSPSPFISDSNHGPEITTDLGAFSDIDACFTCDLTFGGGILCFVGGGGQEGRKDGEGDEHEEEHRHKVTLPTVSNYTIHDATEDHGNGNQEGRRR